MKVSRVVVAPTFRHPPSAGRRLVATQRSARAHIEARLLRPSRASGCRRPHGRFVLPKPQSRAIALATERSSRARSGPARRRTTGSSPKR
jgi:hypothetical protein